MDAINIGIKVKAKVRGIALVYDKDGNLVGTDPRTRDGIHEEQQNLFAMIRENVQETVGHYLSMFMDKELSHFLGRDRYVRCQEYTNHRNGSYHRKFTLKGIGEVDLKVLVAAEAIERQRPDGHLVGRPYPRGEIRRACAPA